MILQPILLKIVVPTINVIRGLLFKNSLIYFKLSMLSEIHAHYSQIL